MNQESLDEFIKRTTLTDQQFMSVLYKIRKTVINEKFSPEYFDDTTIGSKKTESNCGFCNDDYTEADTAYFPDLFPERKSMKNLAEHQKCPFDVLEKPGRFVSCGCFYRCFLFHGKVYGREKIEKIRELVKNRIAEWEAKKESLPLLEKDGADVRWCVPEMGSPAVRKIAEKVVDLNLTYEQFEEFLDKSKSALAGMKRRNDEAWGVKPQEEKKPNAEHE